MTRSNWILVTIILVLMAVIGTLVSYGMYVKGTVDGGTYVHAKLARENWIKDYIQGGIPVCVDRNTVYEVQPLRAGVFKARKKYSLGVGGGPEQ